MRRLDNSARTYNARRRLPLESSTPLAVALSMILTLTLLVSGCCSPTSLTAPPLPPGKPKKVTAEKIAHELLRHHAPGAQEVTIPTPLLIRIFAHLDEWRAWALALEEAGRWSK